MNAVDLISQWQEMIDTQEFNADSLINLAELIDMHFTPKQSMSEIIARYTIPEIIEHWFAASGDPHAVFEQVGGESLRLYFVNNKIVELALAEIRRLEFKHKCEVTEEIRLLIGAMPLPKETIEQLVKEVREHVEND